MISFFDFFKHNFFIKVVLFIWAMITSLFLQSQDTHNSALYQVLKSKDSIIFERAFNRCELEKLEPLISDNFEFYHDLAGIQNKTEFFNAIRTNICGNAQQKILRKLNETCLSVFPLKNNGQLYGAIQKGEHTFYIAKNGKTIPTGNALFTHLWILEHNNWKLKRVLSYNHNNI